MCRTTCAVETTPKHNFSQVAFPRVKVLFEGSLFFSQLCQKCLHAVKHFALIICYQGVFGVSISKLNTYPQVLMILSFDFCYDFIQGADRCFKIPNAGLVNAEELRCHFGVFIDRQMLPLGKIYKKQSVMQKLVIEDSVIPFEAPGILFSSCRWFVFKQVSPYGFHSFSLSKSSSTIPAKVDGPAVLS